MAKQKPTRKKAGRPTKIGEPSQLDHAKYLLGRRQYSSVVAQELQAKYKISLSLAYELIGKAQESVYESLRGEGKADDPLTAQYLFLQSVIADEKESTRDRIAASQAAIKLLGLHKLVDFAGALDADEILAAIMTRRQKRLAEQQATSPPVNEGSQ